MYSISARRKFRILLLIPLSILILLGLGWLRFRSNFNHLRERLQRPVLPSFNITFTQALPLSNYHPGMLVQFWDTLSHALVEAKPTASLPDVPVEAPINDFSKVRKPFNFRPDMLDIPQEDVDAIRDAHSRFAAQIPTLASQLPYARGTRGIVTAAAGSFMPILIVSLRMLRRTGTTLPVEVFMESNAVFEPEICNSILPALNARCLVLSEFMDAVTLKLEISRYQLKAFAIMFSSFDEALLLDSDSIAVENPELLLDSEPFISKGLVSWPDYWANTASPKFYEISSQPVPSPTVRASSESGQLLISKTKHASTLLLILYYNYYGPSHYYTLLSQGAVGQGDKETYLAAAMSLNTSFYAVSNNIETLGFEGDDKRFHGCGTIQFNPEDDYKKNVLHDESVKDVRRSFVHAQTYKMDAGKIPSTFHQEINKRMWGPQESMREKFGRDLEKQVWGETLFTGCHLEHSFQDWQNKTNICKQIRTVYQFLFA